jgi:ketosteroid isomerase-like protein
VDTPDVTANKAVVAGLFQAINDRRYEELGTYLHVDVIDENSSFLGDDAPAELAYGGILAQLASFDSYHVDVEALIAERDLVVAIVAQRGAQHDATGAGEKGFHNHAAYLFTMARGKIARVRAISDGAEGGT